MRLALLLLAILFQFSHSHAQFLSRLVSQQDSSLGWGYTLRTQDFIYKQSHGDAPIYLYGNSHVKFDTLWDIQQYIASPSDTVLHAKLYDAQNNLICWRRYDQYTKQYGQHAYTADSYTYANGKLIRVYSVSINTPQPGYNASLMNEYIYAGNGVLQTEIVNSGTGQVRYEYQYDQNGNLASQEQFYHPGSLPIRKYLHSYFSNKLISSVGLDFSWGAWDTTSYIYNILRPDLRIAEQTYFLYYNNIRQPNNYQKRFFYYPTGDVELIFASRYDTALKQWLPTEKDSFGYDQAHNEVYKVTQLFSQSLNNYENYEQHTVSYNSYNQPLEMRDYVWNNAPTSQWQPAIKWPYLRKFIYELYATDIKNTTQPTTEALLYPSPASDFIQVSLTATKPSQAKLAIFDIQGRLLRQWTEDIAGTSERTIPVNTLASGNYILHITTTEGTMAKQFAIQR